MDTLEQVNARVLTAMARLREAGEAKGKGGVAMAFAQATLEKAQREVNTTIASAMRSSAGKNEQARKADAALAGEQAARVCGLHDADERAAASAAQLKHLSIMFQVAQGELEGAIAVASNWRSALRKQASE